MQIQTKPVYYDNAEAEPAIDAPGLSGEIEADVAVIGGGLAGLATAISLVERGVSPVVIEAKEVGAGASARSGGFVQLGWAADDNALVRLLGEGNAAVLFEQAREAVDVVRRRIEEHAIRTSIGSGVLEACFHADAAELEQKVQAARIRHRTPFEVLSRTDMQNLYPGSPYRAGLLDPVSFHVDPLALARGYARGIAKMGGRLFEQSPVRALVVDRDGFRVITTRGQVRARQVVLATSVYGHDPDGRSRRALLPVMSYIAVTEPLGQRLAQTIRASFAVHDDRFATGYWRPLPDTRLLWGGRVGLSEQPRGLAAKMRADLAFIFPALVDARFDYLWAGRMGFTRHRMPLAGRLAPGLWLSTGFCGHGLGTTTAVGELLAEAIVNGNRRIDLIARLGRPWTGGVLGPLAAQAFYGWLDVRDRIRLRGLGRGTL